MSIKRTKQRSFYRGDDGAPISFSKPKEPEVEKTWEEHMDGKPDEAFVPYALSASFSKGMLISHSKFGKGIVLVVDGSRIESLFAEGKKKLGHKPA